MNVMQNAKFPKKKQASALSQLSSIRGNYEANQSRAKVFEKQFLKMTECLEDLTHYTVKGNNLESKFYIKIEILLQRVIGGLQKKEHHFPILIRSRRLPAPLRFEYPQVPEFFNEAIQLPGANINIVKE